MKTASISELKDGLSSFIEGVRAGTPVLVTDRRKPVAVLQALPSSCGTESISALLLSGIAAPRQKPLDAKYFLALPKASCEDSLAEVVLAERDAR